ncbi:MAG TPA: hypothetical protein VNJ09_10695 [Chthonomonadales bacterium]|nr:hypothetical protein [Chthonomonadales bacterium]
MSSKERAKLLLVAVTVVVANILDLLSTYIVSPDLTHEWNILHREFGLGWSGLIAAKIVWGMLAVAGYAYYLRNRIVCYPSPGIGCKYFYRYLVIGEPNGQGEDSKDHHFWQRILVTLGYLWAGMQIMLFWVALDNILLLYEIQCVLRQHTEFGYHMIQGIIVASFVLFRFYAVNYARYQASGLQQASNSR